MTEKGECLYTRPAGIFCVFSSVVSCCRKFMPTASSGRFCITGCLESYISFAECCRLTVLIVSKSSCTNPGKKNPLKAIKYKDFLFGFGNL